MNKILSYLIIVMLCFAPFMAQAQQLSRICITTNGNNCIPVDSDNPFPINGSISTSTSGFHQESVLAPFTATVSGVTSSPFTAGKVLIVNNVGATNTAYCQLGNSATTSSQPIPPASWIALTSTNETTFSCITGSSTTVINTSVGSGLPTGAGGSSGGGGGGGSVTQGTTPWVDSITTWASGTLGAMANYGTSPGAVLVPGVNAFITNTPTMTANAGTNLNTSALALETGGNLASVKTNTDNLNLAQASTTSGQKGALIFGAVTTGAPTYTTAQTNPLSLTTAGALRIDGSTTTQPVSATSLPLPTGASTAANQTSVIGTLAAGTAATNSLLTGGVFNTSAPSLTNGQQVARQVDTSGNLLVNLKTALPAGSNIIGALTANQSVNLAQVGAASLALGQTTMAASMPVTMASNQAGIGSLTSLYPQGAIPETVSATGTTGATTATLATAVGKTTYICGFAIRANATSAATGTATVTGTITATMSFVQWTAPLASGIGTVEQRFVPCIPASTTNTGIAVVSSAPGTGGTVSVAAWGFQL